ncbi:TIR domain-containing protein [Parafrankia sp. FMc2]|uniref:TIR domain-containing protein n=1 Tax=Parafrankia sp. FMc2 TaxID=3233196 RepID=UPI0034D736FE
MSNGDNTDSVTAGEGGWDFFVSYTQPDQPWAEWIAWNLEEAGYQVLIQAWDFIPGSNWVTGMNEGVARSARTIAVLSHAYARSVYGAAEWRAAWASDPTGETRKLLAVRVEDCLRPGLLGQVVSLDLFGLAPDDARSKLLQAARLTVSGTRAKPTTAPPFPSSTGAAPPPFPAPISQGPPATTLPRHPGHSDPASDFMMAGFNPNHQESSSPLGFERASNRPNEIIALHLSGLRCDASNQGRTKTDKSSPGSQVDRLVEDLFRYDRPKWGRTGHIADFIVVSGDLTENAMPQEFDDAAEFLDGFATRLGLPRDRIIIVPGIRDVNKMLCASYFFECAGNGTEPLPPYGRKWIHYQTMLRKFYGPRANTTFEGPTEWWSLFTIPELRVVVAGLNSTLPESHDHSAGKVGEEQLQWFNEQLRQYEDAGWLRLGLIHHNPSRPPNEIVLFPDNELLMRKFLQDREPLNNILAARLNLILHGQVSVRETERMRLGGPILPIGIAGFAIPEAESGKQLRYQLLNIGSDAIERDARRYHEIDGRWVDNLLMYDSTRIADSRIPCHMARVDGAFPLAPRRTFKPFRIPDHKNWNEDVTETSLTHSDTHYFSTENHARYLLETVLEIARLRHPGGVVEPVEPTNGIPTHLRIRRIEGNIVEQRVVGFVDGDLGDDLLRHFSDSIQRPYAAVNPNVFTDLVYTGRIVSENVRRRAFELHITPFSLMEYQGVLDLREYLERQTRAVEMDQLYPPHLYVPQRMVRIDTTFRNEYPDAAEEVLKWLHTDEPRFILVLGDFGRGKTFLTHELARRLAADRPDGGLPRLIPLLVELRTLTRSHNLDALVSLHLAQSQQNRFDLDAFRYMLRNGRLVLLFDGFDELALRVSYERALEHLDMLISAVERQGQAKLVLTSRAQYFLNDDDVLKKTLERVDIIPGRRIARLEDFDSGQIYEFLVRQYDTILSGEFIKEGPSQSFENRHTEARYRATEQMALIGEIRDLPHLARNPRLLSFITRLDADRLRQVQRQEGTISAASLYRELIDTWLRYEEQRATPRGAAPGLTKDQRLSAATALAMKLWGSTDQTVGLTDLTETAVQVLAAMTETAGLTEAEVAQMLGTGTLLTRDTEGRFSFIHSSIMEYLAVSESVRLVQQSLRHKSNPLDRFEMSSLMVDFFVDIAGTGTAQRWALQVTNDPEASPAAKGNAVAIANRLGIPLGAGASLAGVRLAGGDLSHLDLSGADLRRTDLRDTRLVGTVLDDADLAGSCLVGVVLRESSLRSGNLTQADLSGALVVTCTLSGAALPGAVVREARLEGANLSDADLTGADFTGTRLVGGTLSGALLSRSQWRHASLLGVEIGEEEGRSAELRNAAVVGRDAVSLTVPAGRSRLNSIMFSPDASLIASGGTDGTVTFWDATSGTQRAVLLGHKAPVTAVAFAPDGVRLATAGLDGLVRVWDVATGQETAVLSGGGAPATSVAFSPDSACLATAGSGGTRLWDPVTAEEVAFIAGHTAVIRAVTFSPDGSQLATAGDDGTARLWDRLSHRHISVLSANTGPVTAVAFSPDGSQLATAGDDGTARLWDLGSRQVRATWSSHSGPVSALSFSPSGNHLAAAGHNGALLVWDCATGQQKISCASHDAAVTTTVFRPDGRQFVTSGRDGVARLWDVTTGRHLADFTHRKTAFQVATFSPDGDMLALTCGDMTVELWDPERVVLVKRLSGHTDAISAAQFAPSGEVLATAGRDRELNIWDAATGRLRSRSKGDSPFLCLTFSPNGLQTAVGSNAGTAQLYDVATGRFQASLAGHDGPVLGVAYSPDGRQLATAGQDGKAQLWDLRSTDEEGNPFKRIFITGHNGSVTALAYSPDGRHLATAGQDGTAQIWDLRTGSHSLRSFLGHSGPVLSLAYSPDGTLLLTGGYDGSARLWEVATGALVATVIGFSEGWATIISGGQYKIAGSAGGRFWWSVKTSRFEPGVLDPYLTEMCRIPNEDPIPLPAGWRPVASRGRARLARRLRGRA